MQYLIESRLSRRLSGAEASINELNPMQKKEWESVHFRNIMEKYIKEQYIAKIIVIPENCRSASVFINIKLFNIR